MRKKTTEAGLEYVKKVGIKAAKDRDGIKKELERACGKKEAAAFLDEFKELSSKEDVNSYECKNRDYKTCMIFTGGYDADIIRKCCNWVDENKGAFGKKVLDVGCDCGIMTCFLGLALPESEIVAIDRGENGIKVAGQLAEKLGVTNVRFVEDDLSDFDESGFDTVFTMRTVLENGRCREDLNKDFLVQVDELRQTLMKFAKLVASKVKDGGNVITIENIGRDTIMAGWLGALYEAGLRGSVEDYKELICKEVGETVDYHAFILKKAAAGGGPAGGLAGGGADSAADESGLDFFLKVCDSAGEYRIGEYRGWTAKMVYETQKGELMEGYSVTGSGATLGTVFALYSVKNDPDRILFYQSHEGEVIVQLHPVDKKAEIQESVNSSLDNAKKYSTLTIESLV